MHHLILGIIVYASLGFVALVVAYGVVAPIVDKIPVKKITKLTAAWIALLLLMPILSAYGASFLEDKSVTYLCELGHEWLLGVMLLGGICVSLYRRWRRRLI